MKQIIEKIEKLYALASGGATEGEAKAAIAMAQKLTLKYNIPERRINKNRYRAAEPVKKVESTKRTTTKKKDEFEVPYGYVHIMADMINESEKAVLLNVYLNPKSYPWTMIREIKVSIWMPKRLAKQHKPGWVVERGLLMQNLNKNRPWLREHHHVFKGILTIEFDVIEIK